jgi:hypothetical protein
MEDATQPLLIFLSSQVAEVAVLVQVAAVEVVREDCLAFLNHHFLAVLHILLLLALVVVQVL